MNWNLELAVAAHLALERAKATVGKKKSDLLEAIGRLSREDLVEYGRRIEAHGAE